MKKYYDDIIYTLLYYYKMQLRHIEICIKSFKNITQMSLIEIAIVRLLLTINITRKFLFQLNSVGIRNLNIHFFVLLVIIYTKSK